MLTKNFYSLLNSLLSEKNATIVRPNGKTTNFSDSSFQNANGISFFRAFTTDFGTSNRNAFGGVRYGTGNSPATIDDADLESEIPSNSLGVIMPSEATVNFTSAYMEYTTTISVKNLASADIPIREIGLFATAYQGSSHHPFLVDRTVLDEPITIPAGESRQITYTIRFNYGA